MIAFRISPVASTLFGAALILFVADAKAADKLTTPARLVPAKGLTVLFEYDGVSEKADAWKGTAAYAILNATPAGETLANVARQIADQVFKDEWLGAKMSMTDIVGHADHLFEHGFLVAVYDNGNGESSEVTVLKGFGSKDARARTDRLMELLKDDVGVPTSVTFRGRKVFQAAPAPKAKEGKDKKDKDKDKDGDDEPVPPQAANKPAPAPIARVSPAAVAPKDEADKTKKETDKPSTVLTWWYEGDDLIITDGLPRGIKPDQNAKPAAKQADAIDMVSVVIDAIEGKTPNAATHPGREAAIANQRGIDGFVPNGLLLIESANGGFLLRDLMEKLDAPNPIALARAAKSATAPKLDEDDGPKAPEAKKVEAKEIDALKLLGLDRLKRVTARWGFRGKGLVTVVGFEIPGPRTGMLSLIDQPSLRADHLPPIPNDAGAFVVGSFDLGKSYDKFVGSLKSIDADAAKEIDAVIAELKKSVNDVTGQRLREDLLGHLGPEWCIYTTRCEIWESAPTPVPTLVVQVRDRDAFAKVLDALVKRVNDSVAAPQPAVANDKDKNKKEAVEPPSLVLERLPAPEHGYKLVSPEGVVPWLSAEISPTILLGKSYVVVAMNPELARAAIAAESRRADAWVPGSEVAKTLAGLPAGLTSLSVGDVRDSAWPEVLSRLPRIVQYFSTFLGAGTENAAEPGQGSALLTLMGVPAPGGFRIKISPAKVPRASEIRALLFPSVLATVVDDRGIRFIGTEALPFACIGGSASVNSAAPGNFGKINLNRFLNR